MQGLRAHFASAGSIIAMAAMLFVRPCSGAERLAWSSGQTVYVPAYSQVYTGDHKRPFLLTTTLVIRNSDPSTPITVSGADYLDSSGRVLRRLVGAPLLLRPLCSLRYVIEESDRSGGSGASFLVNWRSSSKVSQPVLESVMIGTGGQQGISFTSRGQVVRELP